MARKKKTPKVPKEEVRPIGPQEYVCIESCFFQSQKFRVDDPLTYTGKLLNKNFRLASIPAVVIGTTAPSALNRSLQEQLQTYISLNRLDMTEELEKRGLSSVEAFPTEDAVALIDELRERYEASQRQGPEVGADVKASEDETGEVVEE